MNIKIERKKDGLIADDRDMERIFGKPSMATTKPLRESQIEKRLVQRVKELGGESRKVKWIGRSKAPDRIVMLPPRPAKRDMVRRDTTIWVEVKPEGSAATFPNDAHEEAQAREHARMRKMGQRVEVVDSYERIEEILK